MRRALDAALVEGEPATRDMVRLELLHSARSSIEFAEIHQERDEDYERIAAITGQSTSWLAPPSTLS